MTKKFNLHDQMRVSDDFHTNVIVFLLIAFSCFVLYDLFMMWRTPSNSNFFLYFTHMIMCVHVGYVIIYIDEVINGDLKYIGIDTGFIMWSIIHVANPFIQMFEEIPYNSFNLVMMIVTGLLITVINFDLLRFLKKKTIGYFQIKHLQQLIAKKSIINRR